MLDPSHLPVWRCSNATFMDHYLDVPVDLSKVLFLCTANVTDTIPGPLLDRMEVVRLSGYILDEKMEIARQYLEPVARQRWLRRSSTCSSTSRALELRPAHQAGTAARQGVRNLQKHFENLLRTARSRSRSCALLPRATAARRSVLEDCSARGRCHRSLASR